MVDISTLMVGARFWVSCPASLPLLLLIAKDSEHRECKSAVVWKHQVLALGVLSFSQRVETTYLIGNRYPR